MDRFYVSFSLFFMQQYFLETRQAEYENKK